MSNTDRILEALGELDDSVLENAFRPKRKKTAAFAAMAAALSLLAGFAVVYRSGLFFEDKRQLSFNYYAQTEAHILTADELAALGAEDDGYARILDVSPSELFELYNVKPLMNGEFFLEGSGTVVYNSIPAHTQILYTLIEKESGKVLKLSMEFTQNGEGTFSPRYGVIGGGGAEDIFSRFEKLTFADGSEGFVADRCLDGFNVYKAEAVFCHNGIGYRILAENGTDIAEMKLLLKKLGVIAENIL